MNEREKVALKLLQIKAIRLSPQNPFTWASGLQSPIYCDNRLVLSYPDVRGEIIGVFANAAQKFAPFDIVAGVATAGIAHGALLAAHLGIPFVYVRSKAKGHGRQNQIEGMLKANARTLVIEDLISTGGSVLSAVDALRDAGAEVVGALAIFQYGFADAERRFEEAGCPFATLTDFSTLISVALKEEHITSQEENMLRAWHADPHNWQSTPAMT